MSGDISIGAVGAALIAGAVSLVGLIISKEQKTSEFRQAWVDSLRSEITAYLTSFNAISDAVSVPYTDHAEKVKALAPLYSQLNQASFAITLRVNPDEPRSKAVLACMRRFYQIATNDADMVPANIKPVELDFLRASKELLKYEWKRVKRGELTFLFTKILAALVVLGALWYWWSTDPYSKADKNDLDGKAAIINNITNERYEVARPTGPPNYCISPTARPVADGRIQEGNSQQIERRRPIYRLLSHSRSKVATRPALSGRKRDVGETCVTGSISPGASALSNVQNSQTND